MNCPQCDAEVRSMPTYLFPLRGISCRECGARLYLTDEAQETRFVPSIVGIAVFCTALASYLGWISHLAELLVGGIGILFVGLIYPRQTKLTLEPLRIPVPFLWMLLIILGAVILSRSFPANLLFALFVFLPYLLVTLNITFKRS